MPQYKLNPQRRSYTAHIQEGRPFAVERNQTLLQAALDNGVDWPYGCRTGVCGTCRCQLLHGHVSKLGTAQALDDSPAGSRYVLACRSLLKSDVLVLPPAAPNRGAGERQARVTAVERLTDEIVRLEVMLAEPFAVAYRAGQYARVSVPGEVPPRCFSFASAASGDNRLEFHIRLFPEGRLAQWLTSAAREGQTIAVSPPLGDISLEALHPPGNDLPLLFVAGGTGIAPVTAMLEELASLGRPPDATVLYAARDQAHLYVRSRFEALAAAWSGQRRLRFVPVLSRERDASDWTGLRGHLFDHLDSVVEGLSGCPAYLCGPPGLVDAVELALVKRGWPLTALKADRFLPAWD